MNEENIRKYAKLMAELGLTGIEITEDNRMIRLERNAVSSMFSYAPGASAPVMQEPCEEKAAPVASLYEVRSPMVGVYYSAPAENAETYVRVGDKVKKGDTLCIIEAMKLMNEVVAERDGVVEEICVGNGQVVEYGTVLFRLGGE